MTNKEIKEAITAAVKTAIEVVGMEAFKRTSFFVSSRSQ